MMAELLRLCTEWTTVYFAAYVEGNECVLMKCHKAFKTYTIEQMNRQLYCHFVVDVWPYISYGMDVIVMDHVTE